MASAWDRLMPDAIDAYKILQVDPEAEEEVITAAYRRLARKYHPDLSETPDAPARMAAINAAWELIGDPAKRVTPDRTRRARARAAPPPPPPAPPPRPPRPPPPPPPAPPAPRVRAAGLDLGPLIAG